MSVVGIAELMRKPETLELSDKLITGKAFYRVIVDDPNDDYTVALGASGIPALFSGFSTALYFCVATKCIPTRLSALIWQIEVDYETRQDQKKDQNPLLLPPKVNIGAEDNQIVAQGTFNGTDFIYAGSIQNSAGMVYNPPPLVHMNNGKMTISRNENVYSVDVMSLKNTYENTTNAGSFWTWDAGYVCLDAIGSDLQWSPVGNTNVPYLAMVYQFSINPLSFDQQLLDIGTWYLDDDNNKVPFLTQDGQPAQCLLDGTGGLLGTGTITAGSTLTPYYNTFQFYPQVDWSPLSLPNSYLDCISS